MELPEPNRGPYSDIYQEFIEYVRVDIQKERKAVNRRMFHVFFWCFVMPALTSLMLVFMAKFNLAPKRITHYLDWLIVVFPIAYAVYLLSFDVLREAPGAIRRGGIAATLSRAIEEERWRARVCGDFRKKFFQTSRDDRSMAWRWLIENYQIDLQNLQNRNQYLTALAGAVFFLLFQGIDALDPSRGQPAWSTSSIMGFFENSSSNLVQFVGLGVFLVLFYISGNQVYLSLVRYLQCAKLVAREFIP